MEKLVEQRTRKMVREMEKRAVAAEQSAATLSAQLLEKEIERHVVEAATKLGLRATAIPDIELRARTSPRTMWRYSARKCRKSCLMTFQRRQIPGQGSGQRGPNHGRASGFQRKLWLPLVSLLVLAASFRNTACFQPLCVWFVW